MPAKHNYQHMISVALATLNEGKGSTRQEMWKLIQTKFPDADYKQYIIRLKKLAADDKSPFAKSEKNASRFKLSRSLRDKIARRTKKGMVVVEALHSSTMKKKPKLAKKRVKKAKKPKKAKKAKKAKKSKKPKKSAKKGKKSAGKKKNVKAAVKAKAKANKKTAGSAKS